MVMTAKVDIKKIAVALAIIAGVILAVILLFGGNSDATPTAASVSNNDSRVEFLKNFGWEVTTSPTESGKVRIPEQSGDVFARYNTLQKTQGYDLSQFAGETVMRYVYKINNFPGYYAQGGSWEKMHSFPFQGKRIQQENSKGAVLSSREPYL